MIPKIGDQRCRTTILYVDGYEDNVLSGRFHNAACGEAERFASMTQLILKIDRLLDTADVPQPFSAVRSFSQPAPLPIAVLQDGDHEQGKLATFEIRIFFRQNASWQGSVIWLDQGRQESFRSVLELITLIDSALTATTN